MSLPSKLRVAGFAGGMVGKVRKAVMDSAGIQGRRLGEWFMTVEEKSGPRRAVETLPDI